MGYARLMLLTLAVVIVSIAVLIGVQLFSDGMTNSNFDSLLKDSITMATSAQVWKSTPQVLGGSPDAQKTDPTDYSGATFTSIGYKAERLPRCYRNADGVFAITPTDFGLRITAANVSRQNRVIVMVRGTRDGQVVIQDGPLTSQRTVKGGYYLDSGEKTVVYTPVECTGRIAASSGLR